MPRARIAAAAFLAAICLIVMPAGAAMPPRLGFSELYVTRSAIDIGFSDKVKALAGHDVAIKGYMAPPLKAEARFFVLTREPMAVCPFCSSDADWPMDIVVVYLADIAAPTDPNRPIIARGRLETGSWIDPDTGFVSQLRLRDASFTAD